MKSQAKIQKWGNSLAIRLTGPVKELLHLEEGMPVELEATESYVKISPAKKPKKLHFLYSESELIQGLDAYKAHADSIPLLTDEEVGYDND